MDRQVTMECPRAIEGDAVQTDVQREFERELTLSDSSHTNSNRVEGRTRILRASDVLLSLAGKSTADTSETFAGIENFKETLRIFPPFRDNDGARLGAVDVKCPDCDAIFSSQWVEPLRRFDSYLTNSRILVDCTNCGEKCNVSFEPILNDPRDDVTYIDSQPEIAVDDRSRSPSIAQNSFTSSMFPTTATSGGEQYFAKRAKKIRDSWSFRSRTCHISFSVQIKLTATEFSQSEEDELIAISFAGLYDLERVHAPNGFFQPFDGTFEAPKSQAGSGITLSAPVGLSRAKSASNSGNKLIKRVNTVRFSFVAKSSRHTTGTGRPTSEGRTEDDNAEPNESKRNETKSTVPEAEYVALLRSSQNIFIHMEYLSGGTMIHDASGRQRILGMEEVAQLFLQLKDQLCAATIWSRALKTRLRAEAASNKGNFRAAVVEYEDALKMLNDCPALDIDKLSRAAMLHSLGQAYRGMQKIAESEACYLESLGLVKRTLGRENAKNFAILSDLGALYENDGHPIDAAALYERSYAGRLKILGRNAPETLVSMYDLASVKILLGEFESALFLLEKAVPVLDTVFGMQSETTLGAMNKLSILYQKLRLEKESRTICGRTIPHYKTVLGINSAVTREVVLRYIHLSRNFDFPFEIKDIFDHYQRSQDPEALVVIHQLGEAYMRAGLFQDAANLFETLVERFLAVKGPEALETFASLSALCVCHEHLDSIEKAIHAYKQMINMACQTPDGHPAKTKKIKYSEKRIAELTGRQERLATEKKEWGLLEPGQCATCGSTTSVLCHACKIHHFCSENCRQAGLETHIFSCVPSVSLRQSKSIAARSRCPPEIRDQAFSKIGAFKRKKFVDVLSQYTFSLDPRNFTTLRMKLNPSVNTVILFASDSDIRYTTIESTTAKVDGSVKSSGTSPKQLEWLTPEQEDFLYYNPSQEESQSKYLLVAPGENMHKSIVNKRVRFRSGGGDKERFQSLEMPNKALIEYAQGILLSGYLDDSSFTYNAANPLVLPPLLPQPWKLAFIHEELNIPYTTEFVGFENVKKEPYIHLNPNGRLPSIEDPNTGIKLWESGAIVEYLIEKYDVNHDLSYDSFPEKYQTKQWLHFQVSGQGPYYSQAGWFLRHHPENVESAVRRYANEIRRVTSVLESVLKKQEAC
ncbi:hypothetical protein MW887_005097 [Aspergillus wentii]|nr:hypothetical protein MW887_005097 [Aspergillus wentii]